MNDVLGTDEETELRQDTCELDILNNMSFRETMVRLRANKSWILSVAAAELVVST